MAKKTSLQDEVLKVSEPGSFKGYDLKIWFGRNKDTLKMLLMAIVGVGTYAVTTFLPIWANVGLSAILAAVAKLGVDALDYFASETIYFNFKD